MVLNLTMSFSGELGSMIRTGTVMKWHRREGDRIEPGDDLFDLRVEEVAYRKADLDGNPAQIARLAVEQLRAGDFGNFDAPEEQKRWVFTVRITSSDTGVLQRIITQEGGRAHAGATLATLTTDAGEILDEIQTFSNGGSLFRVIVNPFDLQLEGSSVAGEIEQERSRKGPNFFLFWGDSDREDRVGIYVPAGRQLNWVFAAAPMIQRVFSGRCCIVRQGLNQGFDPPPGLRSDLLLQSLQALPSAWLQPVVSRMKLRWDSFHSGVFESSFTVDSVDGCEAFPKNAVFLSIVPDVIGRLYRHREFGFVMDARTWWLQSNLRQSLGGTPTDDLLWFHETFEDAGELSVEGSMQNLTQVIRHFSNSGARVILLNTVAAASGAAAHSYQLRTRFPSLRRLEFNVALAELSRKLNFPILDVDRTVKRAGINSQWNWDYFDTELYLKLAEAALGILKDLGVFREAPVSVAVGKR